LENENNSESKPLLLEREYEWSQDWYFHYYSLIKINNNFCNQNIMSAVTQISVHLSSINNGTALERTC
jgi:hypothetical protein